MAQEGWNCDTAEESEGLVPCSNSCGCFGGAATMNLCSDCYGELLARKQGSPSEVSLSPISPAHLPPAASCPFSLSSPATAESIQPQAGLTSAIATIDASSRVITEFFNPSDPQPSTHRSLSADLAPISNRPFVRKHPTNRCLLCRKRMGLLAYKCRCGNVFCASHRYSDEHGCSFDYKSVGREAIAKANPIVIAKKVVRI